MTWDGRAADSGWRTVGASGEPAFQNGWQNYGSGWPSAAFRRDGNRVQLRGLIKAGTVNAAAFVLPPGYRPAFGLHFSTVSSPAPGDGDAGRSQVLGDGSVVPNTANGFTSLDGISFIAEA